LTANPEKTPEQRAFDAFWGSRALGEEPSSPLELESGGIREARVLAAQAVAAPLEREIADLRALLDGIGVMAANAPEDGDSFGLLEQIAMRVAAAGASLANWARALAGPEGCEEVTGRTLGELRRALRERVAEKGAWWAVRSLTCHHPAPGPGAVAGHRCVRRTRARTCG
jgi:hypothetical protein